MRERCGWSGRVCACSKRTGQLVHNLLDCSRSRSQPRPFQCACRFVAPRWPPHRISTQNVWTHWYTFIHVPVDALTNPWSNNFRKFYIMLSCRLPISSWPFQMRIPHIWRWQATNEYLKNFRFLLVLALESEFFANGFLGCTSNVNYFNEDVLLIIMMSGILCFFASFFCSMPKGNEKWTFRFKHVMFLYLSCFFWLCSYMPLTQHGLSVLRAIFYLSVGGREGNGVW